jgi:hypothetical protein
MFRWRKRKADSVETMLGGGDSHPLDFTYAVRLLTK